MAYSYAVKWKSNWWMERLNDHLAVNRYRDGKFHEFFRVCVGVSGQVKSIAEMTDLTRPPLKASSINWMISIPFRQYLWLGRNYEMLCHRCIFKYPDLSIRYSPWNGSETRMRCAVWPSLHWNYCLVFRLVLALFRLLNQSGWKNCLHHADDVVQWCCFFYADWFHQDISKTLQNVLKRIKINVKLNLWTQTSNTSTGSHRMPWNEREEEKSTSSSVTVILKTFFIVVIDSWQTLRGLFAMLLLGPTVHTHFAWTRMAMTVRRAKHKKKNVSGKSILLVLLGFRFVRFRLATKPPLLLAAGNILLVWLFDDVLFPSNQFNIVITSLR